MCFKLSVLFLYKLPWSVGVDEAGMRRDRGSCVPPVHVLRGQAQRPLFPLCHLCQPCLNPAFALLSVDPSARASPAPHIQDAGGPEQPHSGHF